MDPAEIYDSLAPTYDETYATPEDYREDALVQELLWPLIEEADTILDVGCGTGLLLDLHGPRIDPAHYCGMDISPKMVDRFKAKHPEYVAGVVDCIEFFDQYAGDRWDLIVGLYGSPTYLPPSTINRMVRRADVTFLMFTQPGYIPRIHAGPAPWADASRTEALLNIFLDRIEVVGEHVVTVHRYY